jgi:hypothetical protein
MPTVLRIDGLRFYFYSHEPNEPPHIHVDQGSNSAKVWLEPVTLARNVGFRPRELTHILRLTRTHREQLVEAWHEHFGPRG